MMAHDEEVWGFWGDNADDAFEAEGAGPARPEKSAKPAAARGGGRERDDPMFAAGRAAILMDRDCIERFVATSGEAPTDLQGQNADNRYQREGMLREIASRSLLRNHVFATAEMEDALRSLSAAMPNMGRAAALIGRALRLSRMTGRPLRVPPILLVGPPGVGKTRFATKFAGIIGTRLAEIDGTSTVDQSPFVGYPPGWRRAEAGLPARTLTEGPSAGPVLFVDEIDKVSDHPGGGCSLDGMLRLLEPDTAGRFTDAFVGIPMDASGITWIFTANEAGGLSKPLLSRLVVVDVPALTPEEADAAIGAIAAEVFAGHGVAATVDAGARDLLRRHGLREARRAITLALPDAIEGERPIGAADVRQVMAELGGDGRKASAAGFIRHGDEK